MAVKLWGIEPESADVIESSIVSAGRMCNRVYKTMDTITQLQDKLRDMTNRLSHEIRYFLVCAPSESIVGEQARMPIIDGDDLEETKETLASRAEYSARAFIALNLQFDRILSTLPADEGDESNQYLTLEKLAEENERAGEELEREAAEAEIMLQQVRGAMKAICDDRCADALQQLSHKMDLLSKGLDTDKLASYSTSLQSTNAGVDAISGTV